MLLEFAESGHPIFHATSPLSRGRFKSKGHGKLSIHYCADLETIETVFRIIVHVNQLGLYGYQTQIETNTGIQLSAISPAIPNAIRYAGSVLSRFTVRPDGRTPFQYLLGTPYVSPLCMFW